jgi:hypothetical protein
MAFLVIRKIKETNYEDEKVSPSVLCLFLVLLTFTTFLIDQMVYVADLTAGELEAGELQNTATGGNDTGSNEKGSIEA